MTAPGRLDMNRPRSRWGVVAASIQLLIGAALLAAPMARAQTLELKLQFFQGPQNMSVRKAKELAPEIEKMTEGRVKLGVFDSGTLAKGPQMFEAVEKGVVDIGAWVYSFASAKNLPFLMLGSFPFIYRDSAGYIDTWNDDSLVALANEYVNEVGYRHVALTRTYYTGFYQIGLRNKEARVPGDLKGSKIRSLGSIMPFFQRNGITAVNVDPPSVYEALERGVIDGAIGVYSNWVDWGWGEPATYLVDFNLAAVGLVFLVNKSSMAKLKPSDRVIVDNFLKWLGDSASEEYLKADVTYKQVVSGHLMKIYTPTADEVKEWADTSEEIKSQWLKIVGERGAKALKIVEKHNAPLTYKKK